MVVGPDHDWRSVIFAAETDREPYVLFLECPLEPTMFHCAERSQRILAVQ